MGVQHLLYLLHILHEILYNDHHLLTGLGLATSGEPHYNGEDRNIGHHHICVSVYRYEKKKVNMLYALNIIFEIISAHIYIDLGKYI